MKGMPMHVPCEAASVTGDWPLPHDLHLNRRLLRLLVPALRRNLLLYEEPLVPLVGRVCSTPSSSRKAACFSLLMFFRFSARALLPNPDLAGRHQYHPLNRGDLMSSQFKTRTMNRIRNLECNSSNTYSRRRMLRPADQGSEVRLNQGSKRSKLGRRRQTGSSHIIDSSASTDGSIRAQTLRKFTAAWLSLSLLIIFGNSELAAQLLLGTPQIVPGVETSRGEYSPEMSADGRTLYFTNGNYANGADIWAVTRDSVNHPWNQPYAIDAVNTSRGEASPTISPDGRELYFDDAHRAGFADPFRVGGMGLADIWRSTWDEENSTWSEPVSMGPISSEFREYGPDLSRDGLEIYFSSYRPGGSGAADLWVSRRASTDMPWGEPVNLTALNTGSYDEQPAISPDGKMLVFGSNRPGSKGSSSLWLTTRESVNHDWDTPVYLGDNLNGPYWTMTPEFSHDGQTLYYSRYDSGPGNTIWQVDLRPLEGVSLKPGMEPYTQTFDAALTANSAESTALPPGWTTTNDGVVFGDVTTAVFPPTTRSIAAGSVFNVGADEDPDRALAVGATRRSSRANPAAPTLQFLTNLEENEAVAFQLQFDLEAWAAVRSESPGEAAFNVSLEVDSGEGFSVLHDFGTVTTGATLSPPEEDYQDGNLDSNSQSFDSGVQLAEIPAGSALRFRWEVPESAAVGGWVFGIDDVTVSLHDNLVDAFDCSGDGSLGVLDANCASAWSLDSTLAAANLIKGDADGDGQVQFSDFLILSTHFGGEGQYTDGDFDGNGQVQFADFLLLSSVFGQSSSQAAAVPEPSGLTLSIGMLVGLLKRRRSGRSLLNA